MRTGLKSLCAIAFVSLLAACSQPADNAEPSDNAAPANESTAGESTATNTAGEPMDTPAGEVGVPSGERGGMCGGIAAVQCIDSADYCMMETGQCNTPDASGVCAQKPEMCTEEMAPVCGCDGQTYSNACKAGMAGVSVASEGECTTG